MQIRFKTSWVTPLSESDLFVAKWLTAFENQTVKDTLPKIVIKSGEFEVVSLPIVSRFDSVYQIWNSIAFWINRKFDKEGTYKDGSKWFQEGNIIPQIGLSGWWKLQQIGRSMKKSIDENQLKEN